MAETPIEFVLRAMGNNYPDNTLWDKLDRNAVLRAADEIAKLRAELKSLQESPPQAAGVEPATWQFRMFDPDTGVGRDLPWMEWNNGPSRPSSFGQWAVEYRPLWDHPPAVGQEWEKLQAAVAPFIQHNSSEQFIDIRVPTSAVTRLRAIVAAAPAQPAGGGVE